MSEMDLGQISKVMRHIDICMMATHAQDGTIDTRPMSNNRDVDFSGDVFFFTDKTASVYDQLSVNPHVTLSYIGTHSLLNRTEVYISLAGSADMTDTMAIMQKHWVKDLDVYFENGIDTLGLIMIHVKATRIKYWDGQNQGELIL